MPFKEGPPPTDNGKPEPEGGPPTPAIDTSSIIKRLTMLLWGAGTLVEQDRWHFNGGSQILEKTRRGIHWFDFTTMQGGTLGALMRLAEASAPAPSVALQATPFVLRDHRTITPRDWVYDEHYIKGFLSATIAPGGGGKTSLKLVEGVALASGKNLLGPMVRKKHWVWYWNGEEPLDELERRVAAICLHYNITQADLAGYLFLNSGRDKDSKITVAEESERGGRTFKIAIPLVEAIKQEITAKQIDVMSIDPFIRTHAVSENDNQRINAVADVWSTIAYDTQCAIDVSHHTRKGSVKERGEYTAEDSRGASSWIDAARSVRVLNQMTEDEAPKAQVKIKSRRRYFRTINDKANMVPPPENSQWYKYESVSLDNARDGLAADNVGVVTQFIWPQPTEVRIDIVLAIQQEIALGNARVNVQAREWAGHIVARHLAINLSGGEPEDQKAARARVKAYLKQWVACGWLGTEERLDAHREQREVYKVGNWASEATNPNPGPV
jgi:hypothetical protein